MAIVSQSPSISEVKTALAETANSVGGLCTSPKINKWSKNKPIRNSKIVGLVDLDFKQSRSGLIIPFVASGESSNYIEIINYYRNNSPVQFTYNKPRGVEVSKAFNEPFRLGDFRGYEHNAEIFYDFSVPSSIYQYLLNINLNTYDDGSGNPIPGWLDWNFLDLENHSFGVIVVKKGQTNIHAVVIKDTTLAVNDNRIQINMTPLPPTGTVYDVFAFIHKNDGNDNRYYLLEEGHMEVTFTRALTLTVSAEMVGNSVEYDIRITNNTGNTETTTGMELLVRYADNSVDDEVDALEPFERLISLGSAIIPAYSYKNISDQISGVLPEFSTRGGYIYLRIASHKGYNEKVDIVYS